MAPRAVAPTSTDEAAEVLRAAARDNHAVLVRGAGTKQDWGNPPRRVDLVVDTGKLTGVVEHAAGDLIVVVRAGQQLGLDSPLPGATVGGTVAMNTSGPRRMLYGSVRDLLIGVTLVRADGVVAKAGGKVVKNVAGYDLGKLVTGSYGTLGLITECVFRLHPLPAATAVVRRHVGSAQAAGQLVAAVLGAQVVPSALEVDMADGVIEVAVLLEGVPEGVEGRVGATRAILGGDSISDGTTPGWWGRYPWHAGDVGIKLTAALSGVASLLAVAGAARDHHDVPLRVRGSAGTGVLYAGLPASTDPAVVARIVEELRAAAVRAGGHAVVLTAPAPVRDQVDIWGPVPGLDLMRRIKQQFDPDGRLAPGRFVGGI
jgi:glycolate oxidase FAD binding subunit